MVKKYRLKELDKIKANNSSGSNELLIMLNNWFIEFYEEISLSEKLFIELENHFSSFQSIVDYLHKIRALSSAGNSEKAKKFFVDFNRSNSEILNKIINNALEVLKLYNKIITISNSSQIYYLLSKFVELNPNLEVIVSESRPVFEGRILADKLDNLGIKTILITEAMIPQWLQKADCVIIGADKVLPNGDVVNKIGSKLLALTAHYYDKPFYVIADQSKKSSINMFSQQQHDSSEIWKTDKSVIIKNYYFEKIENEFITKIITE